MFKNKKICSKECYNSVCDCCYFCGVCFTFVGGEVLFVVLFFSSSINDKLKVNTCTETFQKYTHTKIHYQMQEK